jgi:hypothetical protein
VEEAAAAAAPVLVVRIVPGRARRPSSFPDARLSLFFFPRGQGGDHDEEARTVRRLLVDPRCRGGDSDSPDAFPDPLSSSSSRPPARSSRGWGGVGESESAAPAGADSFFDDLLPLVAGEDEDEEEEEGGGPRWPPSCCLLEDGDAEDELRLLGWRIIISRAAAGRTAVGDGGRLLVLLSSFRENTLGRY